MKKSILFIMPYLPGGGAEKVLIEVLRNFDYSRYDVSLFLEFRDGVYVDSIPENVSVHSMWGRLAMRHERLFRLLRMFRLYGLFHLLFCRRAISSVVRGKSFDAIVSFMEGNALKYHSYVAGNAKKNVSWVHIDLKKKHWSLDFFKDAEEEKKAYHLMDEIVFVSDDARKSFLEMYADVDRDKCKVIRNLIDGKEIMRQMQSACVTLHKRGFTICMAGRLNRQKRYDRAILAAQMLKNDGYDFELWILGTGELLDGLVRAVHECRLDENVIFMGFRRPPYPYMKAADVYLNTSEAEGYPLVVCEALALGIPVVATSVTGTKEILGDSEYGLLVKEDVEDIYNGLKRMADDAGLREEYHLRSLRRAEMFDVEVTMNQIYEVLG